MRLKGPRLQLGMELHADEPGMVLILDDLRQHAVGREPRKAQAVLLQAILVGGVDFVAMAVTLGNLGRAAVDSGNAAAALERGGIGAEAHGAAEIAALRALFQLVA